MIGVAFSCSAIRSKRGDAYLIVSEWLLYLFARGEKSDVEEGGHSHARDRVPPKLADQLERQEEEIYPDTSYRWKSQ